MLQIIGFKNIYVESFKQLPILWDNNSITKYLLYFFSYLTRIFVPDFFRMKNKWIRFSKEIMILSIAEK